MFYKALTVEKKDKFLDYTHRIHSFISSSSFPLNKVTSKPVLTRTTATLPSNWSDQGSGPGPRRRRTSRAWRPRIPYWDGGAGQASCRSPPTSCTLPSEGPRFARPRQCLAWEAHRGCRPSLISFGEWKQFELAKEVRYQELRARRRSTTVDCIKYIMNMKSAICKGMVLLDGLGLNQCLLIGKPPPQSWISYPMCFQGGFGSFYRKLSECGHLEDMTFPVASRILSLL